MRTFDRDKLLKTVAPKNSLPDGILEYDFLDIEIGAGTGMFALDYSKKYKDRALISIEKTTKKFSKFNNAFQKVNRDNLFPMQDNGISWCAHHLKTESVDRFFFLYPNPNPKSGDLNKRFYAMPFMGFVIECLKLDGEVIFATNEKFYRDEAIFFMTNEWKLKLNKDLKITSSEEPLTLFEKKYLERGQTCYHFSFSK
jgi:tRNA (guanine-N7-)-methyltransferase